MIPAAAIAAQVLGFVAEHFELFELLYEAITTRKVARERLVEAIKAEMTRASDELVARELGG